MASPLFNFSGLASGLDTNSIVESLMQVERAPITRLQIQRAGYDNKIDAWTAVTSKVSEFRTAVDALSSQSDFDSFVGVESSDEDALGVQLTGTPATSSVSLNVVQLAATHQIAAGTFSASDSLVGAGTFSITNSAGTTNVSTDSDTTVADLAKSINTADAGVNATIIQVSDTDQRLLLTAADSGADGSFTIGGGLASFATSDVVATGADATVRIGDPVTGLDVTRSTNTFTNVIDGVTLDLKEAGTGTVNVAVSRDSDAAIAAVNGLVDAANGVLAELDRQTQFNSESNTSRPLTNDATARNMVLDLRSAMSDVVSGSGSFTHLGGIGIEFTRDGNYVVDETELREALDGDFDGVVSLFARSGSIADSRATYIGASGATIPGSYEVVVTTAAETPAITGSAYVASAQFQDFTVTLGDETAVVGIGANSTLAEALTQINDGLAILGLDEVLAEDSGGAIGLSTPGLYGSSYTLEVSNDTAFGLNGTDVGVDVAGTIGGELASGTAQTLLSTAGSPSGTSVLITATSADLGGGSLSLGNIDVAQGLAGGLDGWLDLIEGIDGEISRARGEWDDRIETIDDSIAAFEDRMVLREQQLRREFTAMEQALAQLQNQSQFLAGFLTPQSSNS